ncbi:hypothetical protein PENTCL1PPCAC_6251, partial [Pristionchus entomophagus]
MVPRVISQIFTRHKVGDGTRQGPSKGAESSHLAPPPPLPLPPRADPSSLFIHPSFSSLKSMCFTFKLLYLGSFPVSSGDEEEIYLRMAKSKMVDAPTRVQFTINNQSLTVSDETTKKVLLTRTLAQMRNVFTRRNLCEVAFVAMEPPGSIYRRQCHLFHLDEPQQVDEMECVLDSAHRAFRERDQSRERSEIRSGGERREKRESVKMPYFPTPSTPLSEKRTSSTAFLSRLLGSKPRDDISDEGSDPKAKRRRRPVSAVFSQALHRFSSSTSTMKRMSTIEIPRYEDRKVDETFQRRITPPLIEEETTMRETPTRSSTPPPLPQLLFDEKTKEYYYPVDEALEQQLAKVAYFVKNPARETVHRQLLAHPPGAFIVRSSDKRSGRCLVLSMRVGNDINQSGIIHYQIVRMESGFKIRNGSRCFPSIQCLCTHYSVMKELLPCPLVFVQWKKAEWDAAPPRKPKVSIDIEDPSKNNNTITYKHYSLRQRPISIDFIDNEENNRYIQPHHTPTHRHSLMYHNSRMDYRHSRLIDPDTTPIPS